MHIYVDGELAGTTVIPEGEFGTNANPLRVAGQGNGIGFEGIIDEVAVYSVALTPKEIKEDMEEKPMEIVGQSVYSSGKLATSWASIKARD